MSGVINMMASLGGQHGDEHGGEDGDAEERQSRAPELPSLTQQAIRASQRTECGKDSYNQQFAPFLLSWKNRHVNHRKENCHNHRFHTLTQNLSIVK